MSLLPHVRLRYHQEANSSDPLSERKKIFPRKSSAAGLRVSRILMDDAKMSIRRGGMRIRMIPGWKGGRALPEKSFSWVIKILYSITASAVTLLFVIPLGGIWTWWPIFFIMGISPWWTFSSSRKFIGLEEGGIKFAFAKNSGSIMERAFHVAGSQGWISAPNLPQRRPLFEHFQDKMNHNASAFKTWFSMANFRVYQYVLANQIFNKILSSQTKVYHGFISLSRVLSRSLALFSLAVLLLRGSNWRWFISPIQRFRTPKLPRSSISRSGPRLSRKETGVI